MGAWETLKDVVSRGRVFPFPRPRADAKSALKPGFFSGGVRPFLRRRREGVPAKKELFVAPVK